MNSLGVKDFLEKSDVMPIIDVRSPGEYSHGHIPGALNIPLFSDNERASVGTMYKRQGRKASVKKGLEYVGPKMVDFIKSAEKICPDGKLLIHCWRGGMRSGSMAWLFRTAGFDCEVLEGGYKAYRRFIRENILENKKILVLGGLTGSGKTVLLKKMQELGEPVVDLEGLAKHRGSAFGGIGLPEQPNTEQFENLLFQALGRINDDHFWLEDESLQIGRVFIPKPFFDMMRQSSVLFIDVPDEYRIDILVKEYAELDIDLLEEAINKIKHRLGDQAMRQAVEFLKGGNFAETARILLAYYDKTYTYGLNQKQPDNVHHLDLTKVPREDYPQEIINQKNILLNKIDGLMQ